MPIYEDLCSKCGHSQEEIRSVTAPQPEHCGQPMVRQLGTFVQCHNTRGGNWMHHAVNRSLKGNKKRKTISRGNGLGGRRKPPTMAKLMGNAIARAEKAGVKL